MNGLYFQRVIFPDVIMSQQIKTLIALLIVVGLPVTTMIWFRYHQSSGFAGTELIVYPLLFGSLGIAGLLLIKRYFLNESLGDFNSGKGSSGAICFDDVHL